MGERSEGSQGRNKAEGHVQGRGGEESQRRLGEPRLYKTSINEEEREKWK